MMTDIDVTYFTEIEEHFQRACGVVRLLSPRDWALVDQWKNSGVPLAAVRRGIDVTFENWRRRRSRAKVEMVNSLAYCAQAIAIEAQRMINCAPAKPTCTAPPFTIDAVRNYVKANAATIRKSGHEDLAASLEALDLDALYGNLEALEQRLTAIEEQMIARLYAAASDEALFEARRSFDLELKPYRGKMNADQITRIETQFLDRRLLQEFRLPRLSLFYL